MKLCVAGTRGFYGLPFYIATRIAITEAVGKFKLDGQQLDEVVSGMCPNSPDMIGVDLAHEAGVPVKEFHPDWDDILAPNARIKYRGGEPYNANAGPSRNKRMAEYLAEHDSFVVLVWDGKSPGTKNFKKHCDVLGLRVHEFISQDISND